MSEHSGVIDKFIGRLNAAVTGTALLKVAASRTGHILDACDLRICRENLPESLLSTILRGESKVDIRIRHNIADEDVLGATETIPAVGFRKSPTLLLEGKLESIRRYAELAQRETGSQTLWFGYPLLFASPPADPDRRRILAPAILWPIELTRDVRTEGRYIVSRPKSAAPRLNLPMVEWLRRELGTNIAHLANQILDVDTIDELQQFLQALGGAFQNRPTLDVSSRLQKIPKIADLASQPSPRFISSAFLGHIRWQNASILNDLNRIKDLPSVDGSTAAFTTSFVPESPPPVPIPQDRDRFLVTESDFSQEAVIWQSRLRPGLVVHGPPGTGKTQTIVNMIADALAQKRTVLMICQKPVATQVVYKRLKKAGLHDLCLQVHDPERDRQTAFKSIRQQVDDLPRAAQVSDEAPRNHLAEQIRKLESELDTFDAALYAPHARIGKSYLEVHAMQGEILAQYSDIRPLPRIISLSGELSTADLSTLAAFTAECGQLFSLCSPLTNPFRHRQPDLPFGGLLQRDLAPHLENLARLNSQHFAAMPDGAGVRLPVDVAGFLADTDSFKDGLSTLSESALTHDLTKRLLEASAPKRKEFQVQFEKARALYDGLRNMPLAGSWHACCAKLTVPELAALKAHAKKVLANEHHFLRFLNTGFRNSRRILIQLNPTSSSIYVHARELLGYLALWEKHQDLYDLLRWLFPGFVPSAKDRYSQADTVSLTINACGTAQRLLILSEKHLCLAPILQGTVSASPPDRLAALWVPVEIARRRAPAAQAVITELTALLAILLPAAIDEPISTVLRGDSIESWLGRLSSGAGQLDSLQAYESFRAADDPRQRETLAAIEEFIATRGISTSNSVETGAKFSALLRLSLGHGWIQQMQAEQPLLVRLTPTGRQSRAKQLAQLLEQKRKLEAQTIHNRWLPAQIEVRAKPWNRTCQLRSSEQNQAKRLREAVELGIPDGLLALRPCWLTTPEAAAQMFPLTPGLFDLVIFDEASQCPLEQAVPAIFRGQSIVVSGDEKQLPPTSFFASSAAGDQDDDTDVDADAAATTAPVPADVQARRKQGIQFLLDSDDLLQAAIGILPNYYLLVHYRSDHPALIEFSNRAFYAGRLEIPPARLAHVGAAAPITFVPVGGLYTKNTNPDEAKQLVVQLRQLWNTPNPPTIGIVTFNRRQRDHIAEVLDRECHTDPAFAGLYESQSNRDDDGQDVSLFIKNLENVQGDERDVIVFSTTFGKNENGVFLRNFGPIGQTGGERRLNVAVTRARRQVIILNSMPISEIANALAPAGPTEGITPAGYMQLYLAYAREVHKSDPVAVQSVLGRLAHTATSVSEGYIESPLEAHVAEAITKAGLKFATQVGVSGFRIDMAVLHPDHPGQYVLGIECDGAAYHSSRSARVRDVWRQDILENRGWTIHRVWSTQWWANPHGELQRLLDAVHAAM